MPIFTTPRAFGLNSIVKPHSFDTLSYPEMPSALGGPPLPPHASHPALPRLTLLVFEAVLEVVCVSLPGYIVARQGMFTAEMQKFTANLNVALFTPCLIFTKLASQLSVDKLAELAIIPVIFTVQTLVSYLCSLTVSKLFGFSKRPRNFVIAMGVFGNSNSLPISLVLSLSQTIRGLHWDKIENDNDNEVGARGILYLLIFQQLGQLVRWSWGYNVLLAPPDKVEGTNENANLHLENGDNGTDAERERLLAYTADIEGYEQYGSGSEETRLDTGDAGLGSASSLKINRGPYSGQETPATEQLHSSSSSQTSSRIGLLNHGAAPELMVTPTNGNVKSPNTASETSPQHSQSERHDNFQEGIGGLPARCRALVRHSAQHLSRLAVDASKSAFKSLPIPLQRGSSMICRGVRSFCGGVWSFMNPPLWAMLAAIVVASIPTLQNFFFEDGTFFKNSVTSAIRQSGGVAVPLILVVLGGNLARNTLPNERHTNAEDKEETKLVIAALISRMLLPILIMAPLLAIAAKFVPVSILDDPIFVIVCFLITGAPSALQLAQICQINNVFMGAMSRLLFQSYVVWILPSTLVLVMCALEVVEWAQR